MRREGRIHGSHVRLRKNDPFEYNTRPPRKPTNHSRLTGSCMSNRVRCYGCHDSPVFKAMCKTKGKYKLKDLDVTRNHRWDGFTLGCPPSSFVDSSLGFSDYCEDSDDLLRYDDYFEYDDQEESLEQSDNHRSHEVMFAIASFLRDMRGAHEVTADAGTPDSISEEETVHETLEHGASNRQIETGTESDCSWSGVDISDSEQGGVDVDGWYLVG